ncbi:MAG TPA: hypothetical protein VG672_08585, partial [Bryobacteraceae bacterium]|nr:hypothetical protein [Bryobacteraceae bacterium]
MKSTPTSHVWLPTLFFTLAGLAAGASPQVRAELQSAGQRRAAPTLALPDASGKVMRLGDYSGRVVLLDFWAT